MINLLKANFARIYKNKSFFFLLLFSTLFAYYANLNASDSQDLSVYLIQFSLISSIVIVIFTNGYIGLDYSNGTIRNKITIGHKRINIYFANLITSVISAFIFYGMFVVVILPLASQSNAKMAISTTDFFLYFGTMFIGFIYYACIFTFISTIISNRVVATIINVTLSMLFIIIPFKCDEIVSQYYFYDLNRKYNPEAIMPLRPSKEAMQMSKAVLDITPIGHMLQIDEPGDHHTKPPVLFLYSLGISIFITSLGIFIFNHKRLN